MNLNKWFISSEDLSQIPDFYLIVITAERMTEIESDEESQFWKYRSIAELDPILRISLDTLIVLSTDGVLMAAARYAWLLYWLGFHRIRILIGPIDPQWKTRPLSTTSQLPRSPLRPEVRVVCDDLFELFRSSDTTLIDVRTFEEYSGQITGYSYIRYAGRIPFFQYDPLNGIYGEISGRISWTDLENYLRLMRQSAFYRNFINRQIVFMCGTGWRASLSAIFADILESAHVITVLDSGWYEWSERYGIPCKPEKNEIFGFDFEA